MKKNKTEHLVVPRCKDRQEKKHDRFFNQDLLKMVIREVSLVKQELSTLPDHMSYPRYLVDSCCSIFSSLCDVL
jgi:hypothetical protein